MKRLFALVGCLWLAGCAGLNAPREPLKVQVLAINDFHGNLLPPAPYRVTGADGSETRIAVGGAEALATAVKQLREGKAHHVFVAAGDLIGASPLLSALFRDEPTLESLSMMGLHLSAVGNHEFDQGATELLRRQQGGCHPVEGCKGPHAFQGAKFQYLAASTIDTATGRTLLPAYAIKHFDGIPIGFIGLTLKGTPSLVMPSGVAGLRFDDEAQAINRVVPELQRQGVQAIVVLIHEGGYPTGGYNGCEGLSGPILDILKRMDKAVDVVVTGHTHRAYNCLIDGRRVTSGDKYGSMVTDIELTVDRNTRDVVSTQANNVLVRLDRFAKDAAQSRLLAGYIERARPLTERVVGRTTAEHRQAPNAAGASAMGELIADAHLAATAGAGAELALMNSCGIRASLPLRADGVLNFEDLYTTQPFGNQLVTLTLSGSELLAMLQRQFRSDSICNRVQLSDGLTYTWDAGRPQGERVLPETVRFKGQSLDLNRDYRITVNNFMAQGGDGLVELTRGRNPVTGPLDVEALEAYVKANSPLPAAKLDRIRRLN